MKEISSETAMKLATADKAKVKQEIEFKTADWIRENANYIAAIECKNVDKTYCGLYPDGWRKKMKAKVPDQARHDLMHRFIQRHCQIIDGVIWLADLKMIEDLERKKK